MSMDSVTDAVISLATLIILEVILGIDNLVFIAISSSRLPAAQQKKARRIGLAMAWVTRLILLAFAVWLAKLTDPLFSLLDWSFSARDCFLIMGGSFLLVKGTHEIHMEMEPETGPPVRTLFSHFWFVISQIAILDIVFSLDSIMTAIGLTSQFWIMATAISVAIIAMIFASEPLTRFIHRHPTVKMLALSFLLLIGLVLVADGFQLHIPRGYLYFAVFFSLAVECLNTLRLHRRGQRPLQN